MTSVSHRMVATSAATATAGVGVGMWLQATSGQAMPPGFLQYALVASGTTALGAFILWHRPRNRYGLAHLAIGVLFGTVVMAAGVLTRAGTLAAWPSWVEQTAMAWSWVSAALLLPLWVIVIAAFPDGRFHRPLLKRATMALALVMPLLAVLGYLLAPAAEPPPLIRVAVPDDLMGPLAGLDASGLVFRIAAMSATVLSVMAPVGAIAALVDRFRKAGPVVRQQIKWLLVGAAISVGLQAIPVQTFDSQVLRTVGGVVVLLAVPLPLIAAAIAIFRHGLWEIDFVISKGLVYTLSSGVLTALFLGIALLAGVSIAGPDDRVVGALALALLVSFLAQPLRQRLEDLVARLLYGDAPRGLMGLARLGDTVGDSPDAASLGDRITGIVISSLGAGWATVWLYLPASGSGWFRVVASSGREAGPSVLVPGEVADWLAHLSTGRLLTDLDPGTADALRPLVSEQEAMVAPLTAAGELIGLIASGRPTTDSLATRTWTSSLSSPGSRLLPCATCDSRESCASNWTRSRIRPPSCVAPANAWWPPRTKSGGAPNATSMTERSSNSSPWPLGCGGRPGRRKLSGTLCWKDLPTRRNRPSSRSRSWPGASIRAFFSTVASKRPSRPMPPACRSTSASTSTRRRRDAASNPSWRPLSISSASKP